MSNKSYYQIIRSTGLFGGAQIINILIGVIRNKLVAVLLGNLGLGLISIFQSTLDLIKSISCLGIDSTGVREIAAASDDPDRLLSSVSVISKWSWVFAFSGCIFCVVFCSDISVWAFDTVTYSQDIAWLSVSLFFNILTIGELVILQGLRKIGYIIKSGLIWNLGSLVFLVPLYYFYGIRAIIPVFIFVSVISYFCTLYYRRKAGLRMIAVSLKIFLDKGKFILRIGFFIILAAIQTQVSLFIVRSWVIDKAGLDQLGLLQAAWTITNVYLSLILKSLSVDLYPRLSMICDDNVNILKLINEQVDVLVIISLPVIIFTLLCSKVLLELLYTDSFVSAYTLLNWRTIGIFFKIMSWPLGFVLLAKGKGFLYFICDTSFSVVYLLCIYFLFPFYALDSVGIAYMFAYFFYLFLLYAILRNMIGFRWEMLSVKSFFVCLGLILLTFYATQYRVRCWLVIAVVSFLFSIAFSIYRLNNVVDLKVLFKHITNYKKLPK